MTVSDTAARLILAIAFLILGGCSTSQLSTDRSSKRDADKVVEKGDSAMKRGDWASASREYLAALRTYEELGGTYGVRGEGARIRAKYAHALSGQGLCQQASTEISRAVRTILTNNSIDIVADRADLAGEFIRFPVRGLETRPPICLQSDGKSFQDAGWLTFNEHRGQSESASLAAQRAREDNAREAADRQRVASEERAANMYAIAGVASALSNQQPRGTVGSPSNASRPGSAETCKCGAEYVQCLAREARRTGARYQLSPDGRNIVYLRPDGSWSGKRGLNADGTCGGVVN